MRAPERAQRRARQPRDVLAGEADAARRRVEQAQHRLADRGLARAALADQPQHLAPGDARS